MTKLVLMLCVLACAGCATTPDQTAEPRERAYRTGSNLPVREGSVSPDVKTVDPATVTMPTQSTRPQ